MEKATFAAGCFWHVQKVFDEVIGVITTRVGYIGGIVKNPSYKEVCNSETGHAEAVEILFDPAKISYSQLLETFWKVHNPTMLNRQGLDIGRQYRSAIFFHSEVQKKEATESMQKEASHFDDPIVTEIREATTFYEAEAYHQKYIEKNQ